MRTTRRASFRPNKTINNKILKKGLLILAVILFWLLISEFILSFLSDGLRMNWGWRWDESPYRSTDNALDKQVNQLGLRGRDIAYADDDFVILLVGDSYVEAGTQRSIDMPESILETIFREHYGLRHVRVFSIASAGWGQDQQLLGLQKYFKSYRADLVVAWITPVNDFWENTFIERSISSSPGRLKPSFKLVNGQLEGPRIHHMPSYLMEIAIRAKAHIIGKEHELLEQEMTGWNNLLPSPTRKKEPLSCPEKTVSQAEIISVFREGYGDITVKTTENIEENRSHFSPFGIPQSAREQYQIEITKKLLERMASRVMEANGKFIGFYPYGSELDSAMKHVKCISSESGDFIYAVNMEDMLSELKGGAVEFVTPTIVSEKSTMISSLDWHLNRLGNELAMRALAASLVDKGWLR